VLYTAVAYPYRVRKVDYVTPFVRRLPWDKSYCHGAGESGKDTVMLGMEPRERRVRPWPVIEGEHGTGGWVAV